MNDDCSGPKCTRLDGLTEPKQGYRHMTGKSRVDQVILREAHGLTDFQSRWIRKEHFRMYGNIAIWER